MGEPNFANRTLWTGDNLPVMRGMNDACVDLIYLDPPFNSNRIYEAPTGSAAAGVAFRDAWTLSDVDVHDHGELADRNPAAHAVIEAARQAHGKGMMSYLIFMAMRLLEMRRILRPTGSLYLHCDPAASHYLKALMDGIFGRDRFRNEIVWCYSGPSAAKRDFARKHDILLRYAAGPRWTFDVDAVRIPYRRLNAQKGGGGIGGRLRGDMRDRLLDRGKTPETWWADISPVGRLAGERTGYPTQKPLALLERIVKASSREGDMVFDPFCGCATTPAAAERLNRRWAGIDLSPLAIELAERRIRALCRDVGKGERSGAALSGDAAAPADPPERADPGEPPDHRTHRRRPLTPKAASCGR